MALLDNINFPRDIKKLNIEQMKVLAEEIREFLLHSLAETGGHLASNLGVVELTLALHCCFNTPRDTIVWDVGHQSYVHKILTGRKDSFPSLRKLDGLSGFPKTAESPYDSFDTGHSSTSVSVAYGMCVARDLMGETNRVIAVIGDGSMTGGLAYEALNDAGRSDRDLIVILNDNQMSISENVGALSRHLSQIRSAPYYIEVKKDVDNFLKAVPVVGPGIGRFLERTKNSIKYLLIPGVFFEELGFRYFGPIDGNNMEETIRALKKIKRIKGPVLLHVITQKGKGYNIAETHPDQYHGIDSFNIETGRPKKCKDGDSYSDIFGKTLVKLGERDGRILAITASMLEGTGLSRFAARFPQRVFDVGIAEGHGVTFAAGLAKSGFFPVVAVYSSFLQRAYDQIVHDVCIQKLPVVFAIDRAGIVGADGETHQGCFDLSYLSQMPNMTVMAPKNGTELAEMLEFALKLNAPCAIRYPRENICPFYEELNNPIVYGKSETLEEGDEIALVFAGAMGNAAYGVYKRLLADGKRPCFINARFVKPVDRAMVDKIRKYKYIFTFEDNVIKGGFGMGVLEELSRKPGHYRFKAFGLPDEFIRQGSRSQLFRLFGLDEESLYGDIINFMEQRENGNG